MNLSEFTLALLIFALLQSLSVLAIESPQYEVIKKIDENTEIRKYGPSKWVRTYISDLCVNMDNFKSPMFRKLFGYISGANDQKLSIDMTVPVITKFKSLNGSLIDKTTTCNMSMGFYVPKINQNNTPKPTGDAILEEEGEMTVAVVKFGWYASMDDYITYRDILLKRLGKDAIKFDSINMMTAGYDPPYKFWSRTNEVWLRNIAL